MTHPHQPPRPGPQPGGFRPGPPPGGFRPSPPPPGQQPPGQQQPGQAYAGQQQAGQPYAGQNGSNAPERRPGATGGTGHPAVDAVLQSLANAAGLAPSDQIAEYEAAHQVLQETLAGIDR